jgi:hypothetical protein
MSTATLALPSGPYGSITEKGYQLDVRMPANAQEETAFVLDVRSGTQLGLTLVIPMCYAPRFGVDVGDSQTLEAVTDAVLNALPDGGDASPADYDRAAQATQTYQTRRI